MTRLAIPLLALALGLGVGAAWKPGSAEALHLRLERSEPAADTTLTAPPGAIRLLFSQPVEARVTSIRLLGPQDAVVDLAPVRIDTQQKALAIAEVRGALPPARYEVHWRTMARDGHVVKGDFAFVVAPAGTR